MNKLEIITAYGSHSSRRVFQFCAYRQKRTVCQRRLAVVGFPYPGKIVLLIRPLLFIRAKKRFS